MDFADNLPGEPDDIRFKPQNRFLRSLREDTLRIVDNFNVTSDQDNFLDVMLKYRCRSLFSTQSRYENQISLEVRELTAVTLLELMGKLYDAGRKNVILEKIIGLLHRHTYAVELATRLVSNDMLKPKALLKNCRRKRRLWMLTIKSAAPRMVEIILFLDKMA